MVRRKLNEMIRLGLVCKARHTHRISNTMAALLVTVAAGAWALPAHADIENQLAKFLANDGAQEDVFGYSVAISGDTAIVGAFGDDDNGLTSGSAYLFDIADPANPGQIFKLLPNDGAAFDGFGRSVAISGATAIVGAPRDDVFAENSGSAYLFDTTTGQQLFKLLPDDGGAENHVFGNSVAISGATAIVGAESDDDNGVLSGSAYLFDTATGQQLFKLLPNDGAAFNAFGKSVAISGATAIVGAWRDDDNGGNSGSAYLFDTSTGLQLFKLLPNDGAAGDLFGVSVAISGATAIVGAKHDDDNGSLSGSAYLYDITTGEQIAKLLANDGAERDVFGFSVAISGAAAIVGASRNNLVCPGDPTCNSGSAYLFDISDPANPVQTAKLLPNDGGGGDLFGWSVAIRGATAIVGAVRNTNDNGFLAGAVYLFSVSTNQAPTAVAGDDQSIHAGDLVFLDGTLSFDDNTATANLLFDWSFTERPADSTASLTGGGAATPTFVADLPGTYRVQLVVTDEGGLASDPDEVVISSANLAPTAEAGLDDGGVVGLTTVLDGANSSDPENDPLTFSWSFVQKPTGSTAPLTGAGTDMPSFIPDLPGLYVVQLVVSDPFDDSAPDTVTITVITGEDFAENTLMVVRDFLANLPPESVTTQGNQIALSNFLSQAITAIQGGDVDMALRKIDDAIARVDGCVLRGEPDGNGPGRDWIIDCGDQAVVYALLILAEAALSP